MNLNMQWTNALNTFNNAYHQRNSIFTSTSAFSSNFNIPNQAVNMFGGLNTPVSTPGAHVSSSPSSQFKQPMPEDQQELLLLSNPRDGNTDDDDDRSHEVLTAPCMTRGALLASGLERSAQYGVLGRVLSIHCKDRVAIPEDQRLYLNTNAPLSALVCGVQGSGKSHTVASILESMFITNDTRIGRLAQPLCGLVLHLGDGGKESTPSEAAWVGSPILARANAPRVRVFVSPSQLNTMRAVYASINNVTVLPLYFSEDELDAEAFLSMMAVGTSENAPLYVQIVLSILRELGENYTYNGFVKLLDEKKKDFNVAQSAGLAQRMSLLQSFTDKSEGARRRRIPPRFEPGLLTVVDLSDPFIDSASACGIFEIVLRLFTRAEVGTGKVLVVDEAHKYLTSTDTNSGLPKQLLTLIREQRHKGMRIIISTQEPTVVPPMVLDLCTIAIMHRFSSPAWWNHVMKHTSAEVNLDAFDKIVKLKAGEAIVFAPSGICLVQAKTAVNGSDRMIGTFARRYMHLRVRQRITQDGGRSVMVV